MPNIRVIQPWLIKLPPDGSNDAFEFSLHLFSIIHDKTSSGARPALPMGVAPEAIIEKNYFEYRLKDTVPTFMSSDRSFTL
jgi:hypothetical protein